MTDDKAVQRLADELELRNLLARAAQASDGGTIEEYAALWTEDAAWEFPGAPRYGAAAIVAAAEERRARRETGPESQSRHLITTIAVQVEEGADEATIDSYWQWFRLTGETPTLARMGKYHDTARRQAGGWRLARRQITLG